MISIVFTEGPRAGERVDVDRDLTVGRSEGDIVLSDHQVSRRHLALRPAGSDLHVEDLGSSNGTFVNGYRIDQPVSAADGDVVQIGSSELIVQASTPEEEPASPAAPAADSSAAEIPPRDRPTALWLATGLVEIAVILTAATLLVYYAVR